MTRREGGGFEKRPEFVGEKGPEKIWLSGPPEDAARWLARVSLAWFLAGLFIGAFIGLTFAVWPS